MKRFFCIGFVVLFVLMLTAGAVERPRSTGPVLPTRDSLLDPMGGAPGIGVLPLLGYKAILQLQGLYYPMGLGISTLGDRIYYVEEYDYYIHLLFNKKIKPLGPASPFPHCLRMRGSLYIGDVYGGIYKIDDQNNSTLLGYDQYGDDVSALDVDLATGAIYFVTNYMIDGYNTWTGLYKLPASAAPEEAILLDWWNNGPCFGLVIKGDLIYTTDYYAQSVWICDKDGDNWSEVLPGFSGPTGLDFDSMGNMFVAEWDGGSVAAIKAGTTAIGRIAYGFSTPYYLQADAANSIYLTDMYAGKIWKLKK
jgi:DNA-binding beta-propeller fold protein YncE